MKNVAHSELIKFLKTKKALYILWIMIIVCEIAIVFNSIHFIVFKFSTFNEMLNRSIGLFGIGLPPTTVSISAFILCILLTIISILGVYKLKKWVLWTWGVILLLNLLFITDSFVTDIFWLSSLIFNLFYNLLMDRIKQFKNSFQQ